MITRLTDIKCIFHVPNMKDLGNNSKGLFDALVYNKLMGDDRFTMHIDVTKKLVK